LETSTPEQDSKTTAHPSTNPVQLFIPLWRQDGLYSGIPSQSELDGNSLKISKISFSPSIWPPNGSSLTRAEILFLKIYEELFFNSKNNK
jgi:hypothetical protein